MWLNTKNNRHPADQTENMYISSIACTQAYYNNMINIHHPYHSLCWNMIVTKEKHSCTALKGGCRHAARGHTLAITETSMFQLYNA